MSTREYKEDLLVHISAKNNHPSPEAADLFRTTDSLLLTPIILTPLEANIAHPDEKAAYIFQKVVELERVPQNVLHISAKTTLTEILAGAKHATDKYRRWFTNFPDTTSQCMATMLLGKHRAARQHDIFADRQTGEFRNNALRWQGAVNTAAQYGHLFEFGIFAPRPYPQDSVALAISMPYEPIQTHERSLVVKLSANPLAGFVGRKEVLDGFREDLATLKQNDEPEIQYETNGDFWELVSHDTCTYTCDLNRTGNPTFSDRMMQHIMDDPRVMQFSTARSVYGYIITKSPAQLVDSLYLSALPIVE